MHPPIENVYVIDARAMAEEAAQAVDREAAAAVPLARSAVVALSTADPASRSIAQRALGHGLLLGGSLDEAVEALRVAVRLAQASGEQMLVGEARLKLAHGLLISGKVRRALTTIDAAVDDLVDAPAMLARAWGTRGLIHRERGELGAALSDFDRAVVYLRGAGDQLGLQRALINRAITRIDTFDIDRATADLREADAIAETSHPGARGLIAANLGHAASVGGDIPEALRQYRRAEGVLRAEGAQLGSTLADRGELLIRVGLADEAFADLSYALEQSIAEGRTLRISELRLLLASAADLLDDPVTAHAEALRALRGFRDEQRPVWVAAAGLAVARFASRLGRTPRWRTVATLAEVLMAAGWVSQALDAWQLVASIAPPEPRREALSSMAAYRSRGPALVRAQGWYAQALLSETDPNIAEHAVRKGLEILDEHVAVLGADDLRAGLARHRLDLAGLGVDLALVHRTPTGILRAVERARATVLVRDTVRPPVDPDLARLLSRYRTAESRSARVDLVRRIQDRTRTQGGGGELLRPVTMRAVDRVLGDGGLAVWFVRGGRLAAVTRVAGRSRLHRLGADVEARSALDRVLFGVRRLARESERSPENLAGLIGGAAQTLSDALFGGLDELRDRELVLVPPPFLHATPWHELPGLGGRSLTVAASVMQWLRAVEVPPREGGTAVAAGPSLPGALAEAQAIASLYGVSPLTGAEATVLRVLGHLGTAEVVHIATHGWLRADNPQFSELRLSDGELMVHHLDTIDRLPSTVILACCDTGRPVSLPGEGMLGFVAACLTRGTRTLIAPVTPVPDGSTAEVMTRLHAALVAGVSPAAALALAQADQPPGRRSFVCFGAGVSAVGARMAPTVR